MITTRSVNPWVSIPEQNSRSSLRLFCFPYAGGNGSMFRTWSHELGTTIDVCPIYLPGREKRLNEAPIAQIVPLVQALADALYPYLLDKPFAFFGHSMGGLISFELFRELRRQYAPLPVKMLISAYKAPHLKVTNSPIHHLPEVDFINALRRYQGISDAIVQNPEMMELLMPILRADFTLCETYVYTSEEPLDCPISVLGGLEDKYVSYESLAAWQNHTRSSFSIKMFPGNHFFLNDARDLLLQFIAQELT